MQWLNGKKKWIVSIATALFGYLAVTGVVDIAFAKEMSSLIEVKPLDWALVLAVGHTVVKYMRGDKRI